MIKMDLAEIPIVDFNIQGIVAIRQTWGNGSGYSYTKTPRPNNGFNIVTNGSIEYTDSSGCVTIARKGDITYLPKGKKYDTKFYSDTKTTCVLVNFLITEANGKQIIFSNDIINMSNNGNIAIEKYFRDIANTYKTSADKLRLKILFMELLQKISTLYTHNNPSVTSIEKCADYINKNFLDEISVATLARKCCISETTFRKRFKEIYKVSPVRYINRRKIEHACEMLVSSDIKINEIAEFLKFYDTSYFYKIFADFKNMTPMQYRVENLKHR